MERFPIRALLAGVLAGLLFTVAVISLIGPVASDSQSQMAAALQDGRQWAVIAFFGAGLAAFLGLWFLSVLRAWLRAAVPDGGEDLGTLALVAATLAVGLALVGISLFYGATYELAGRGGSAALLGLVDAANGVMMMTKFSGAVVVAAISLAASRSGRFPAWFPILGWFSVFALIASSIGLFAEGSFTQFGGPLDFYGSLPSGVWGFLLMAFLYRERLSPTSVAT